MIAATFERQLVTVVHTNPSSAPAPGWAPTVVHGNDEDPAEDRGDETHYECLVLRTWFDQVLRLRHACGRAVLLFPTTWHQCNVSPLEIL